MITQKTTARTGLGRLTVYLKYSINTPNRKHLPSTITATISRYYENETSIAIAHVTGATIVKKTFNGKILN